MAKKRLPRSARLCYIYIVHAAGLHKIGWSEDPEQRVRDMQVGSPLPLNLVHVYPCPSYEVFKVERHAHRALAEFHVRGEWHDCSDIEAAAAIAEAFTANGVKQISISDVGALLGRAYIAKSADGSVIRRAVARHRVSELV